MKQGKLVVVSGPSGVGKGTVIDLLVDKFPNVIKRTVTATTRKPRKGEKAQKTHIYLTDADFKAKIKHKEFLEYNKYDFHYYGTLRQSVQDALTAAEDVIVEVDTGGAQTIKKAFPEAILIFIAPPDMSDLRKRLEGRHTEGEHDVKVRLSKAKQEIADSKQFDHVVVNPTGHPEQAAAKIEKILAL